MIVDLVCVDVGRFSLCVVGCVSASICICNVCWVDVRVFVNADDGCVEVEDCWWNVNVEHDILC